MPAREARLPRRGIDRMIGARREDIELVGPARDAEHRCVGRDGAVLDAPPAAPAARRRRDDAARAVHRLVVDVALAVRHAEEARAGAVGIGRAAEARAPAVAADPAAGIVVIADHQHGMAAADIAGDVAVDPAAIAVEILVHGETAHQWPDGGEIILARVARPGGEVGDVPGLAVAIGDAAAMRDPQGVGIVRIGRHRRVVERLHVREIGLRHDAALADLIERVMIVPAAAGRPVRRAEMLVRLRQIGRRHAELDRGHRRGQPRGRERDARSAPALIGDRADHVACPPVEMARPGRRRPAERGGRQRRGTLRQRHERHQIGMLERGLDRLR